MSIANSAHARGSMARVQHLGQIEGGACRTRLKPLPDQQAAALVGV
jgi:hypothetical protein